MPGLALPAVQPAFVPAIFSGSPSPLQARDAQAAAIGRLALHSLHDELVLYPKPGLVSPHDNGSHRDMTAVTFMRSLFALRHAFVAFAKAGGQGACFLQLRQIGIEAEARMLQATHGVNTHRGAIFCLGMLSAAIARAAQVHRCGPGSLITPQAVRRALLDNWSHGLQKHAASRNHASNGQRVAFLYGSNGARSEASAGYPAVFLHGLPALHAALDAGRSAECARIDALFALMACVSDTNVLHRSGEEGARLVRHEAEKFMLVGGTAHADWRARAVACHRLFVARRISPGGAADLLAASCLIHLATHRPGTTNTSTDRHANHPTLGVAEPAMHGIVDGTIHGTIHGETHGAVHAALANLRRP
jgi:triphosphoribosyl-dephospho-CoA synthase